MFPDRVSRSATVLLLSIACTCLENGRSLGQSDERERVRELIVGWEKQARKAYLNDASLSSWRQGGVLVVLPSSGAYGAEGKRVSAYSFVESTAEPQIHTNFTNLRYEGAGKPGLVRLNAHVSSLLVERKAAEKLTDEIARKVRIEASNYYTKYVVLKKGELTYITSTTMLGMTSLRLSEFWRSMSQEGTSHLCGRKSLAEE